MPHVADNSSKNTYKKKDRLKSSLEIEAVYRGNQFFVSFPLKCYFLLSEPKTNKSAVQTAFSVPKKSFKNAVDRNTIKRRMREAFRLSYKKIFEDFTQQKEKQLKLFYVYIGKEIFDYECIRKNNQIILEKIHHNL